MLIKELKIFGEIDDKKAKEVDETLNNHPSNNLWVTIECLPVLANFRDVMTYYKSAINLFSNQKNIIGLKSLIITDLNKDESEKGIFIKIFDSEPEIKVEIVN